MNLIFCTCAEEAAPQYPYPSGIAAPFALGLLTSRFLYSYVAEGINPVGFSLFMATALSITAMPVLGRIMMELNIHRSMIGSLTMASAAIGDAAGWTILALVSATVRSSFSLTQTIIMVAEIAAYAAFTFWVTRPLLKIFARRTLTPFLRVFAISRLCSSFRCFSRTPDSEPTPAPFKVS